MSWVTVCRLDELTPGRGVRALVGGCAVAVFLHESGTLYALDDTDPVSGASVLSRGLTGSWPADAGGASEDGTVPTVASPLHKQRFDLRTGRCLDADVAVRTWPVRVVRGRVAVGTAPMATGASAHV
jgi:NAD(P)H-dependent nitrite reductase small subunit